MSEVFEIGGVRVDLSEKGLEDISRGKLRNIRIAFREASKIALGDNDMISARSRNIRDISKKASTKELVSGIKMYVNEKGISKFDFDRAVDARQELEKCTWLTLEQKGKIRITSKYIEIDEIKLKLQDESGEADNEGRMFRGDIQPYTLSNSEWEKILDLIGNEPSQQYEFFCNILGMKEPHYVTSSEPTGNNNECVLTIDPIDGVSIEEDFSEGPENWTWGRFKYNG